MNMPATPKIIYTLRITYSEYPEDRDMDRDINIGFTNKDLALQIKDLIKPYQIPDFSFKIVLSIQDGNINKYISNDQVATLILANNRSEEDDTENMAYLNYIDWREDFKVMTIGLPEWLVFNFSDLTTTNRDIQTEITLEAD